ncbi:unnamed protein product [Psylliodes chrysocephalus]|uniref:DNA repair and recombination protein RAD54-like n=1 Tax=Psylliodes chrysocephalus TaxID=3402493 RepID=A0A9P0CF37_9CUCU|nr:unnamed protein product [Psylliodes chrysocephala]
MNNEDNELETLLVSENINVWAKNQTALEEQALKELHTFSKEFKKSQDDPLEEGELEETEEIQYQNQIPEQSLNIEAYIKHQVELKKRQDFNKSLNVENHNLVIKKCKKVKKKRKTIKPCSNPEDLDDADAITIKEEKIGSDEKVESEDDVGIDDQSGSEYVPTDCESDSDNQYCKSFNKSQESLKDSQKHNRKRKRFQEHIVKVVDDGIWKAYKDRLDLYYKKIEEEESLKHLEDEDDEIEIDYYLIKGGLKAPFTIWNKLYNYQQDAVKWLWKIHQKSTGGLLGDEMGLGKTVQIIAFLQALEFSKISSCHGRFIGLGPSLIVCPATVIHQWVKHFHEWAPEFRIAVLHQSGSYQGDKKHFIKDLHKTKGIILTTYLGIIKYQTFLLDYNWHYLILDEGHKIRNPAAKASVAAKLFRTPHKIMLTGSPMQNDLIELWSLFDFTNPGMLGNLKTFQEHFSTPILHGGFSNSTPMQEATALSVATTLKDLITPYLLRRTKHEVQHDILLPNKTEQVLFCSLSDEQKFLYKEYLLGDDVSNILGKGVKNWAGNNQIRARVFVAITKLRKICNHPDIFLSDIGKDEMESVNDKKFGNYKASGKMIVVSALLKIWKKQSHRVLLFSQGRAMIRIFQDFLEEHGYKYLKMDGTTSISSRQALIDKFNTDSNYDVFLLTTRVGGLGVNLTGANRVIIYDPDWNPATDTQARERAWRIGQDKQVTIYRLLAAGTIEEKMYQRQVWKQLLSNKILLDPQTNKFFKSSDLFDLFSLQESTDSNPETVNIFHNSRVRIQDKLREQAKKSKDKKGNKGEAQFSDEKIQQMKNLAQQIAKSLNKKPTTLQLEIEAEKEQREKERRQMKELEVGELLKYNKEKVKNVENPSVNKIDDCDALVGFSEALTYSEKTAELHHNLKATKDLNKIVEEAKRVKEKITKEPDKLINKFKKKKDKGKTKVDHSGKVDGEKIDGLLKMETKKTKKSSEEVPSGSQDDIILGKLFQKKGVFGAVQHDSVIQQGSRGGSLRIHTEARMRAEKSLEALRKSRVDNWRW